MTEKLQSAPHHVRTRAVAACLSCVVAGCSTPIVQSVVSANMAQEEAANKLLLLNVARAHEHMPMHFSLIGQIRDVPGGFGFGIPSFAFAIPFGGAAERSYTLTAGSEGQTPVDVTPLMNQEFVRGMTNPVKPELLAYFAEHGWPKPILLHLFFESVDLVRKKDKVVVDRLLNDPGSAAYERFTHFVEATWTCDIVLDEMESDRTFLSSVKTEVSVEEGVALHAAKLALSPVTPEGAFTGTEPAGSKHFRLASITKSPMLRFRNPPPADCSAVALCGRSKAYSGQSEHFPHKVPTVEKTCESSSLEAQPAANASDPLTMNAKRAPQATAPGKAPDNGATVRDHATPPAYVAEYVLRSPESMLYYLGQLSRVQNADWYHQENDPVSKGPMTIPVGDDRRAVMFQMSKRQTFQMPTNPASAPPAVSVQYAGHTFAVPKYNGNPNDKPQDRSAKVLALMLLVMGLQDKGTEPPGVSRVQFVR